MELCTFSWLSQNPRNELRYPCIQLVHSHIFSMHVKNSTNKMSDCTEFPWKIFAHSSTCLCSNILHKKFFCYVWGHSHLQSLAMHCLIHSDADTLYTASLSVQKLTIFKRLYKQNNETEPDISFLNTCADKFITFGWTQRLMKHIML